MVFLKYETNSAYFVYTERRKIHSFDELHLLWKLFKNRLRTHRVMALAYLPLNCDFLVFLRLPTNSAYLNTFQRKEKVEQHIWQIFWKFHESNRVFDRVMTLALEAFFMFEGCLLNIFPAKLHNNWFVFRKIGPLSRIVFSMVCRCEISHKIDLRIDIERRVLFLADKHPSNMKNASKARVITLSNTRLLSWNFQNICQMCCSTFSLLWNVFKYALYVVKRKKTTKSPS